MYRSPSGETARRESFGQPTVLHSLADRSGSPSAFGPVYLSDSLGSEEDGIKYGNQQRINIDLTGEDQEMLKERLDKEQQEIREYYRRKEQGKLIQTYISLRQFDHHSASFCALDPKKAIPRSISKKCILALP